MPAPARRRAPRRHAVLRAGRSDPHRPGADGLRNARVGFAARHGAGDPQHPRRLPVLGRRRLQEGAGAVGRRTHSAGGRADAAAAVEHPAARRADQPPGSRLEGGAARRARRLRRHAHLRVARPVLRRAARDQDHRGRATAPRPSIRARTRSSCGTRSTQAGPGPAAPGTATRPSAKKTRPHSRAAPLRLSRSPADEREEAGRRRGAGRSRAPTRLDAPA